MVSPRKNRNKKTAPSDFRTLISVIQSPEGIKPPILKKLYCLLVHLSSNAKWSCKYAVSSTFVDFEICNCGIIVKFGEVYVLSDSLFRELAERFEQLFSALFEISANKELGGRDSHFHSLDAVEVVNLLLRCCMLLLTLLTVQQNLVLEKGQILLRILKKLCFPSLVENRDKRAFLFNMSVVHQCTFGDNGCTTSSAEDFTASLQFLEPHNPLLFFRATMIEVFVDELLVHGQLRGYFKMIDSVASANEMLFNPHPSQGDIGVVMEAICNHFVLLFSDKEAFGDFLSRLFSAHAKENTYRAPALSVYAAVPLLFSPIMISAPKYMQAHLIYMVSEATEAVVHIKNLKPDRKLINCFLSIFEKSVSLYKRHMLYLRLDGYVTSASGSATSSMPHDIAHPSFDSFISSVTKKKFDSLITELDHAANQNLHDGFFRMKSDLVSSSMRAVKEFQNVYNLSCQDEILAILSFLIHKVSLSFDDTSVLPIEATTVQDIYLLSSLLKLMSTSLLQSIWCLRHSDDLCCLKTLKDFSLCKEYDFILGTITCFRDFVIDLPLQQVLFNVMSSHPARHKDSKMMFLHFSGLMSLSFVCGLDCLVKGCLLTILALLNLFIFEEGGLDALNSMLDSKAESISSGFPVVRFQETVVGQSSSLVVASKFQKIRSLYSCVNENKCGELETSSAQTSSTGALHIEAVEGLEEETEETSNGEIFLNCMLKMGEKTSEFDDLFDFIECKKGKDYPAWLKNRQRYRKWRFEKTAVLRWKRKKKTWKTIKGKKT